MSEERWPVPDRWCWATIEDIAEVVGGGTPKASDPDNFSAHGIPWLTPADLTGYSDAYISRGARDLSEQGLKTSSAKLMPAGSVLFSSRAPIGYCAIASNQISTNQGFKSLVLGSGVDPEFTRLYLLSAKDYAESKASGTTFKEISGTRVKKLAVPLPPLAEQKRIVAKLDRLSARSGKAKEHLAAVQTLATRAKQATLAAFFAEHEGRELPLSDLVERDAPIRYGVLQPGDHCEDGVPLIRVCDLLGGVVAWNDLRRISSDVDQQYVKARVQDGDVLLSVVGTIGRVAIVSGMAEPTNIARAVSRLRPDTSKVLPSWLSFRLQAADVQKTLNGGAREVARKTLNVSLIKQVLLTVPPLSEQTEIVRRIETAFAKIDRMVEEASRAADLLDRLDQQLLAKAFRGELVPQDPNDEPASALLARIHEARANAPKPKRRRKSARA